MSRSTGLVIHGGTGWQVDRRRRARIRRQLGNIYERAEAYLASHSAMETAVFAVRQLEDDPLFNAGTGSMLQEDGRARMSASVMDGASRRFAAVLNIERVRNPVLIAQALLSGPDRVLDGAGAVQFARAQGFDPWDPVTAERRRQWVTRHRDRSSIGTVGAVALDREGRLAAATSTGGKGFERVGRVSDSGLPVGNYADERVAISCTGIGEDIIEEGLAVRLAQRVADGFPLARAVAAASRALRVRRRSAGLIGLDRSGRVVWMTTLPVLFAMGRVGGRRIML